MNPWDLHENDLDRENILAQQRRQYIPDTYKPLNKESASDSISESCRILHLLLLYLERAFKLVAIPDNIGFLIQDLRALYNQSESSLDFAASSLKIVDAFHDVIAAAFHHPEPVIQTWLLYLFCSSSTLLSSLIIRSTAIDVQAFLDDLVAIIISNPLRWNRLRAADLLNMVIVKINDNQDAGLLCDLIFSRLQSCIGLIDADDHLYSRLILSIGYLLNSRCDAIIARVDICAALVYDGLHSESDEIVLVGLQVLIRSLAAVFGSKTGPMFIDRVTQLSKSPNAAIQSAAVQFLGRFLLSKKQQLSAKSKLKSVLQLIASLSQVPGQRKRNVAVDLLREPFKTSLRLALENRNHRNHLIRDLLRIPQTYARLYRSDSTSSTFRSSYVDMHGAKQIEFNMVMDASINATITIGQRVPQLPDVPDHCTTIPICIETRQPLEDFLDLVRPNRHVQQGLPPLFCRTLNHETDSIPVAMTDLIPAPSESDAPYGFRYVQIIKGPIASEWTPNTDNSADDSPRTIPSFNAVAAKVSSNSRMQIDDFPLYSTLSIEVDQSYPDDIEGSADSASQTVNFEPRMWLGKVVDVADLEPSAPPLPAVRVLAKDGIIRFRVCDKSGAWKEITVQVYREFPVWSLDSNDLTCTRTVIPAGVDNDGKPFFYPPVNIPQIPVSHDENGTTVYDSALTYLPVPFSYTVSGVPYYAIDGQPHPDVPRARLCGYTALGIPIVCSMTALIPRPSGFTPAGIPFYSASWMINFMQLCMDNLCTIGDIQVDLYPKWDPNLGGSAPLSTQVSRSTATDLFQFSFSSYELLFCSTTKPQSLTNTLELIARPTSVDIPDHVDVMIFANPYEVFTCSPNQCRLVPGKAIQVTVTFAPMLCELKSSYVNGILEILDPDGIRCGQARLTAFCGPWVQVETQVLSRAWCEIGRSRTVQLALENLSSKDIFCKLAIHQSTEFTLEDDEIMIGPLSSESFKIEFAPKENGRRQAVLSVNSDEHDEQLFELTSYGGSQMVFEMPSVPDFPQNFAADDDTAVATEQNLLGEEKSASSPAVPEIVLSSASPKEIHAFRRQLLKENRAAKAKPKETSQPRATSTSSVPRKTPQARESPPIVAREVIKTMKPKTTLVELTRSGTEMLRVDFGVLQRGLTYEKSFVIKNRMMAESIIFADFLSSRMFGCTSKWHEVAGNNNVSILITASVPDDELTGVVTEDVNISWPDCCNSHIAVSAFIGCPLEVSLSPFSFFPLSAIGEISTLSITVRNLSSYRIRWRFEFAEMDDEAGFFFIGSHVEDSIEAAKRDTLNQSIEPYESRPVTVGFVPNLVGVTTCRLQIQVQIADDGNIETSDAGFNGSIVRLVGLGVETSGLDSDRVEILESWIEANHCIVQPGQSLTVLTLEQAFAQLPASSKQFSSFIIEPSRLQIVATASGDRMKAVASATIKSQHGVLNPATLTILAINGIKAKFTTSSLLQVDFDAPSSNYVFLGFVCVIDNDNGSMAAVHVEVYPSMSISVSPSKTLSFGSSFASSPRTRRVVLLNSCPQTYQYTASLKQSIKTFVIEAGEMAELSRYQAAVITLSHFSENQGAEESALEITVVHAKTAQQFLITVNLTAHSILPLESVPVNSIDFGSVPTAFQALVKLPFVNNSSIDQCVFINSQLPFTSHHETILIPKHTSGIALLMYRPIKSGSHSHFFYVKSSDKLIQIAARGQAGTLNLSMMNMKTDLIDFGIQETGTITTKYVLLTNAGTLSAQISKIDEEQMSRHLYFIVKPSGVVRRTHSIPASKTIRNPVHVLRRRYQDAVRLLGLLRGTESAIIQQQDRSNDDAHSTTNSENLIIIPPLHGLLFKLKFLASRQGTHTTQIPIEYVQGRPRTSSSSLSVYYLSGDVDVDSMNPVQVLAECSSETPSRKVELSLRGRALGKILITSPSLDFGVVPVGKSLPQRPTNPPGSRRAASVQPATNVPPNVQMLTMINASFTEQSVSTVQVSNKMFSVKLGNWTIAPGAELSIPVIFTPSSTDTINSGFVLIRHNFGDESVQLKGVGGDVRLRFVGSCPLMRATGGVEVTEQITVQNRGLLSGQVRAYCQHSGPFGLIDSNRNRVREITFKIEPDSTHTLTVTFLSNEFELMQGVLTLAWEPTPGSGHKEVILQLAGKVGVAKLLCNVKKLKFPVVLIHVPFKKEIQLLNAGDSACHWKSRRSDSLWTTPESGEIAPDGSTNVTVWIRSHEVQNYSGSLAFRSDGGTLAIPVAAYVTVPQLTIQGSLQVDLGIIRWNQLVSHQLNLHNAGRNSINVLVSFGDFSEEDLHARAASISAASRLQSDSEISEDQRQKYEQSYLPTIQPLMADGFSIRGWFRQMEPDQTSRLDILCTPTESRKLYSTTFSIASGLLVGNDYVPMDCISGSISFIGGSADLQLIVHDEPHTSKQAELTSWTDDSNINSILNGDVSPTDSTVISFGLVLVHSVCVNDWTVSLVNRGNMECDFEIVDDPNCIDNAPSSSGVFSCTPDGGHLLTDQIQSISIRAAPTTRGLHQRQLAIVSPTWKTHIPICLQIVVEDRLLECDTAALDFGRRQTGVVHSLPLKLTSAGRFSFDYSCTIEEDVAGIREYQNALEQKKMKAAIEGLSVSADSMTTPASAMCPFTLLNQRGVVLAGSYSIVEVQFTPDVAWSDFPAMFLIKVNWSGQAITVPVSGRAGSARLELHFPPPSANTLELGNVLIAQEYWTEVNCINTGSLPMDFQIKCSDPDCIRFADNPKSIHAIDAGSSKKIPICVILTRPGSFEGTVEIHSEVGVYYIPIKANGCKFEFLLDGEIAFGDVPVNRVSQTSLIVSNTGDIRASFDVSFSRPEIMKDVFALVVGNHEKQSITLELDGGDSCDLTVKFCSSSPISVQGEFIIVQPRVSNHIQLSKQIPLSAKACIMSLNIDNGADIDLGYITMGESISVPRRLINTTSNTLQFEWQLQGRSGSDSERYWSISPTQGAIEHHAEQDFVIAFHALESARPDVFQEVDLILRNLTVDSIDITIKLRAAVGVPHLNVVLGHGRVARPNCIQFGKYRSGGRPGYCALEVNNTGHGRLDYSISFSHCNVDGSSIFALADSEKQLLPMPYQAAPLPALSSTLFFVRFRPEMVGDFSIILTVTGLKSNNTFIANVSGSSSTFTITGVPRTIDLGCINVGTSRTAALKVQNCCEEEQPIRLSFDPKFSRHLTHLPTDEGEDDSEDPENNSFEPASGYDCTWGNVDQGILIELRSALFILPPASVESVEWPAITIHAAINQRSLVQSIKDTLAILCPSESIKFPLPAYTKPIIGSKLLYLSSLPNGSDQIELQYSINVKALQLTSAYITFEETLVGRPVVERVSITNDAEFPLPFQLSSSDSRLTCSPDSGTVPSHGEVEIAMTFCSLSPFDSDVELQSNNKLLEIICHSYADLFDPIRIHCNVKCRDYCFNAADLAPIKFNPFLIGISPVESQILKLTSVANIPVNCRLRWDQDRVPFILDSDLVEAELQFGVGDTKEIQIRFDAREPGMYSRILHLETAMGTFDLPVSGEAFYPHVKLSQNKLEFGIVAQEYPVQRNLILTNPCPLPLTVSCSDTHPEFSISLQAESGKPIILEPGHFITIRVVFSPKLKKKGKSATLAEHCTFKFFHEGWPEPLSELLCVGRSGIMQLDFSKGALKLGRVPHLRVVQSSFSIKNTGTVPVHCAIMDSNSSLPADTINLDSGWIKFNPHDFHVAPDEELLVEMLLQASKEGSVTFSFRIGLLDSLRERFWYMQIHLYGDKIILSSQSQSLLNTQDLESVSYVEISDNQHVLDVLAVDDRVHTVSIHHHLAMVDPSAHNLDSAIATILARPAATAPEVISTLRHWYASRQPLRLTSSSTPSTAEQIERLEEMLAPVDQRRRYSQLLE